MAIRRLERGDWTGFCLQASRGLLGKWADIEIASLQIGAQLGARHLPLIGISYDPKGRCIAVDRRRVGAPDSRAAGAVCR